MLSNLLLNEAAANRNKRQQLDHLLRIAAPHERVILSSIGVVLLALVAWTLFGSIVRSVTIDGILIKPGVRYEVVSSEPGHLVKYVVTLGASVEAGDPIARQTVPELEREIIALRERIELLEAGIKQISGDGAHSLPTSAQEALLQMEARRAAREIIVSHTNGEVMALASAPGEYLPAGAVVAQIRNSEDKSLQAVLQVTPRMAQRIRSGMQASAEVVMPDGTSRQVDGEVASVTSEPLPSWLAVFQSRGMGRVNRVDIILRPESGLAVPDGTPCRVHIVLGQNSLATLLDPEQF